MQICTVDEVLLDSKVWHAQGMITPTATLSSDKTYICTEILADKLEIVAAAGLSAEIEVDEHLIKVQLTKAN
jgi:hypothetical protein